MPDNAFKDYEALPPGPSRRAAAVTPSDTVDLSFVTRYLWVGGAGNVDVLTVNGDDVTFEAVPAGTLLPIAARRVLAAGTTATKIVALE